MDRVESLGSVWFFHDGKYLRMPKDEAPRHDEYGPRPDWSMGALKDHEWHECESWEVIDGKEVRRRRWSLAQHQAPWLIVHLPGDDGSILHAPYASVL